MDRDNNHQRYKYTSKASIIGGLGLWLGFILLLISIMSNSWLAAEEGDEREFESMGLWYFCFNKLHSPFDNFDKDFGGCHSIYSKQYEKLRSWYLPTWLENLQIFISIGIVFCALGTVIQGFAWWSAYVKTRKIKWVMSAIAFACSAIAALLVLGVTATFNLSCWDRDWLPDPNSHHLAYSWYCALISGIANLLAAILLFFEAQHQRQLRGNYERQVRYYVHENIDEISLGMDNFTL